MRYILYKIYSKFPENSEKIDIGFLKMFNYEKISQFYDPQTIWNPVFSKELESSRVYLKNN